jgi:hypothetical protein
VRHGKGEVESARATLVFLSLSHLALVRVQADVVGDEADVAARLADDGLVVDLGLGRDLA